MIKGQIIIIFYYLYYQQITTHFKMSPSRDLKWANEIAETQNCKKAAKSNKKTVLCQNGGGETG